jgi:hypothetical protein
MDSFEITISRKFIERVTHNLFFTEFTFKNRSRKIAQVEKENLNIFEIFLFQDSQAVFLERLPEKGDFRLDEPCNINFASDTPHVDYKLHTC